ncbi:MAG: lamin tail domain-containing protein, partial [Verrucomicrobiota bacterium]
VYALNGTDPRLPGGRLASSAVAIPVGEPFQMGETSRILARQFVGDLQNPEAGDWSPLTETVYYVDAMRPAEGSLRFSEIHYHPTAVSPEEASRGWTESDFEFIEITNPGAKMLTLHGITLSGGAAFVFDLPTELGPSSRLVLAANPDAFVERYGETSVVVAGPFKGKLSNGGETLQLRDANRSMIDEVTYDDEDPWPVEADGGGFSLVRENDLWMASADPGGSPGQPELLPEPEGPVVEGWLRIERLANGLRLEWQSIEGFDYRIEGSIDLESWAPLELPAVTGDGSRVGQLVSDLPFAFYRLRIRGTPE